jgi:hypothetical protein
VNGKAIAPSPPPLPCPTPPPELSCVPALGAQPALQLSLDYLLVENCECCANSVFANRHQSVCQPSLKNLFCGAIYSFSCCSCLPTTEADAYRVAHDGVWALIR